MKLILVKIVFIVAFLILIDKSFGYLFYNHVFNKTISGERGGVINALIKKRRNIDFLILGSSRAKHQIDPRQLVNLKGKGYNAGENAVGGVLYCSVVLDLLIRKNVKPKSLILQLDPYYFDESWESRNNIEVRALYPFYSNSELLKEYVKQLGWQEEALASSDLFKFNFKVYPVIFNFLAEEKMINEHGFLPLPTKLGTLKINKEITAKIDETTDLDELKLEALERIIHLCIKNDIKLFVVFPPNFKNVYNRETYNNKLKSFILSKKVPTRIIDMSDIGMFDGLRGLENWKDENHLNVIGAKKFSGYLNDSLSVSN